MATLGTFPQYQLEMAVKVKTEMSQEKLCDMTSANGT